MITTNVYFVVSHMFPLLPDTAYWGNIFITRGWALMYECKYETEN